MASVNRRRRQREYDQYELNSNGVPFEGLTTGELRDEGRRLNVRGWTFLSRDDLINLIVEANRRNLIQLQLNRERGMHLNRLTRRLPEGVENIIREYAVPERRVPPLYQRMEEHYANTPTHLLRDLAIRLYGPRDISPRMSRLQLIRILMSDVRE